MMRRAGDAYSRADLNPDAGRRCAALVGDGTRLCADCGRCFSCEGVCGAIGCWRFCCTDAAIVAAAAVLIVCACPTLSWTRAAAPELCGRGRRRGMAVADAAKAEPGRPMPAGVLHDICSTELEFCSTGRALCGRAASADGTGTLPTTLRFVRRCCCCCCCCFCPSLPPSCCGSSCCCAAELSAGGGCGCARRAAGAVFGRTVPLPSPPPRAVAGALGGRWLISLRRVSALLTSRGVNPSVFRWPFRQPNS